MIKKLKNLLELDMLWFFFEENCCQDQKINSQNNRWLAVLLMDVSWVIQTKFPVIIMVFSVINNDVDGFIKLDWLTERLEKKLMPVWWKYLKK